MSTTTNLGDFDSIDRLELIRLLQAWNEQGLPEGFEHKGITFMMNTNSGNIFLANDEFQCAMMNGDKLEIWHFCGSCGNEGFQDTCQMNDDGCNECIPIEEKDNE